MLITLPPLPFSGVGFIELSGTYLYSLVGIDLAVGANAMLSFTVVRYILFFAIYLMLHKEI